MEDKADTSTTRQFVERDVVRVTVDRRAELGAEFRDDVQNNARRARVCQGTTKGLELAAELLMLLRDTSLDVRQCCSDVRHENLGVANMRHD